ncbi:MAG: ABC transporter substrate-binding protein [Acuticoccus sp.]
MPRWTAPAIAIALALAGPAAADTAPDPTDWSAVKEQARGQTVDWYAWGGEAHINDYIAWVGREMKARHGIKVRQAKLADTAEAVSRVLAETIAGRADGGAVDLIWINGENFVAMKEHGLLLGGAWAEKLPNWSLVDLDRYGAAILTDFGVAVEGQEAPWGRAQLVFLHDTARTEAPASLDALLAFAEANPGRFTYPQPPDFVGTGFLKQLLIETVPDRDVLYAPAGPDAADVVRANLIPVLERLHPNLWRSGKAFPNGVAELRRLFADGEIKLALTHNPATPLPPSRTGCCPIRSPSARSTGAPSATFTSSPSPTMPRQGRRDGGGRLPAVAAGPGRKADPAVWGDPGGDRCGKSSPPMRPPPFPPPSTLTRRRWRSLMPPGPPSSKKCGTRHF